ncbi:putative CAAX amino terminal protease family [Candidatus Sulfopaludibacter sp. SbA6]|nr:putative CAAX amino terminal protease family [Candidatus Sulfopaludibacter sp. SbA6]
MQPGNTPEPPRPLVVRVFIGPYGLRSGWRLFLFLLLWGAIAAALQFLTHRWLVRILGVDFPVVAVAAAAATWIAARLEHQPFASFGLGALHRLRNLVSGLAAGFLALSLLMALLIAAQAFDPRGPDLHGAQIARWALYWTVAFTFTALGEELLTRGYALFALSRGIGFWPAAVVLSLLFGAGHIGNRGEEVIGIANAVLAGMVFAFSLWWSGTLWWAIGCHLSWDWAETFFYGVPNSGGGVGPHHLLTGAPAGPAWLSGGTVGPEGSVLATLVLLLLAATVRYTTPRHAIAFTASEPRPS